MALKRSAKPRWLFPAFPLLLSIISPRLYLKGSKTAAILHNVDEEQWQFVNLAEMQIELAFSVGYYVSLRF